LTVTTRDDPPIDAASWRALGWTTAAILVVWGLHNAFLLRWETAQLSATAREPIGLLLRAVVWLVPAAFYLRGHDPRPLFVAWGVTTPIDAAGLRRRGWWAAGYLVAAAILARASATTDVDPTLGGLASVVFSSHGAMLVLGVAFEELLLRGFLLRQMLRRVSTRSGVVSTAALFALLHVPGWIALGGFDIGVVVSGAVVFVMGLVLGSITAASRSIWPAIVVHGVNNVLADWLGGA
jgi:membrane protease YdiL (CAAX protease family)